MNTQQQQQENQTAANGAAETQQQTPAKPGEDEMTVSETLTEYKQFDDMKLDKQILRGVYGYGYERPSKIQEVAIVPFSAGRDVIAQAQSGTGKTATFLLGILNQIDETKPHVQAIILAPTRDLADQILMVCENLAKYTAIKVELLIGGTSVRQLKEKLRNDKIHIVVGTPGRVNHMVHEGYLRTRHVRTLCLDEADEMLDLGFADQIKALFPHLPSDVQVGLFSATMPPAMLDITENFMQKPVKILVKTAEVTLEGIRQFYVSCGRREYKFETLIDLYHTISVAQVMIFCNSRREVQRLHDELNAQDYPVSCVHGDMPQAERKEVINHFREGNTRILLSTNVLARGIDVQSVKLVINYDLSQDFSSYIHRVGRCGRFGRKGVAINFITDRDTRTFDALQNYYQTQIEPLPVNIGDYL